MVELQKGIYLFVAYRKFKSILFLQACNSESAISWHSVSAITIMINNTNYNMTSQESVVHDKVSLRLENRISISSLCIQGIFIMI
uniref:Uncharacterized protein n=1 Tax=Arundo donax TaxID=35708 RepID=A0A0A8YPD5_ARUDO